MKLKIFKHENGKTSYATGGVDIVSNKEDTKTVKEVEMDENAVKEFFEKPKGKRIKVKNGIGMVRRNKRK